MAVSLSGPHIQARGYTKGRNFRERPAVNLGVIHSAEGPTDEIALGNYFKSTTAGSSNAGIGQDGGYASYVGYGDTPWTNPPLNQESDTLETCAFAKWSREQWLAHPKMIESIAKWIAWRSAVRRIPIVWLSASEVKAGKPGFTDHRTVNAVHNNGVGHWDVGYHFPTDVVIARARQLAGVGGAVAPSASYYVVKSGDTLAKIATKNKTTVEALAKANGISNPNLIKVGQRIKVVVAAAKPKTGVVGKFPLPYPHNFYSYTTKSTLHSGYWAADRPYIKMIQEELGLKQDGSYGPKTREAVKAYQRKHGMRVDGMVGPTTWSRMAAS